MKKSLVMMMVGTLALSSVAFAAPRALSGAELDAVTAGQNYELDGAAAAAAGSNSTAVNATDSHVTTAGAVADNHALAVNGNENLAVKNDGNVAVADSVAGNGNEYRDTDINAGGILIAPASSTTSVPNGNSSLYGGGLAINTNDDGDVALTLTENKFEAEIKDVDDGSVAIIGDDNHVTVATDDSEIDVDVEDDFTGVVGKEVEVADSFNTEKVCVDVDVDIKDSFNVKTNTMDISGQNHATAIVNASSLIGLQAIGVNLNVTTATASLEGVQGDESLSVPVIAGNAIAVTVMDQAVINNTLVNDSSIEL